MTGKVLTANRLADGEVVFFAAGHSWSMEISHALVADAEPSLGLLNEQLQLSETGTEVTDAYLFDVETIAGEIRPVHIRERIRTLGPTVRRDLGKQASGLGGVFAAVS